MSKQQTPPTSYTQQLQSDFPGLVVQSIKEIGQGWDHVALVVNGSLIFRIPRGLYNLYKLSKSVAYETALLRKLRDKLPAEVPDPVYIAPGNAYFGYPMLTGELLADLLPTFNKEDEVKLKQDWVSIAAAIHQTVSIEESRQLGIPDFSVAEFIANAERLFKLPYVDEKVLAFARTTVAEAKEIDIANEQPALIHHDLRFHNLLAGKTTNRISGVIDWTDVCIAPRAREFSVWVWMHDGLLPQVARLYEEKTGVKVNQGLAITWAHLEGLSEFVEQTESGESEAANETLHHIQLWVKEHDSTQGLG